MTRFPPIPFVLMKAATDLLEGREEEASRRLAAVGCGPRASAVHMLVLTQSLGAYYSGELSTVIVGVRPGSAYDPCQARFVDFAAAVVDRSVPRIKALWDDAGTEHQMCLVRAAAHVLVGGFTEEPQIRPTLNIPDHPTTLEDSP